MPADTRASLRPLVALLGAASLVVLAACTQDSAPGPKGDADQRPKPSSPPAETLNTHVGRSVMQPSPSPSPLAAPPPAQFLSLPSNTERYPDAAPNPVKDTADEPVSTFSIDVDTASYGNVRRYLNDGILPPSDAVRVEEFINYFDYAYAVPDDRSTPFAPTLALYETPWNKDTRLVHIGIKGFDMPPAERPPANLVFLIDTSGSMQDSDKLPLVKRAMKLLVDQMTEADRISIVVYAGQAGTVLEPTSGADKARIMAAIDRLDSGGSTAGAEGIRQAYALAESSRRETGINRVILATDGDFNVGITDPEALEDFVARKRDSGVTLTVLGFGSGNYNDALMQTLAQAGNGNAAYIDTLNEARKVLVEEMASTLFTIAGDVKIQVEFNPAQVAEYRLIGYETRLLRREDFANDKVDAGDIGAGHAVTALYEIVPVGSPARLTEPLRYGPPVPAAQGTGTEFAHLRIRYKLPGETASRLIERPVTTADLRAASDLSDDMRFAAAVAGFGQWLQRSPYLKDFGVDQVIALAEGAKGPDRFGYRAEFIQLARLAKTAEGLTPLDAPSGGGN